MSKQKPTEPPAETAEQRKKRIKQLWSNKKYQNKNPPPFEQFYQWYEQRYAKQKGRCHYCHISEGEIARLKANRLLENKRGKKRGKHLEIDRKNPAADYSNAANLVLACYWCNNAKTDTFCDAEFKKVGAVFQQIWQARLQKTKKSSRDTEQQ